MILVFVLLAGIGVLAVLLRLSLALISATRYSVERYVARQVVAQRAARGDLSGLAEAEAIRNTAARHQMRSIGRSLGWATLLAWPLFVPHTGIVYPLYSVFWFLPNRIFTRKPART